MKARSASKSETVRRPASSLTAPVPTLYKILEPAAVVLLATALLVRPLLCDTRSVIVTDLFDPGGEWWNNSPASMYASHLLAAAGILVGAVWVSLTRRRWSFSGLEPAILLLVLAGGISVSAASDKRLAINVATFTILPMACAAVLYQVLRCRGIWRQIVLAALLAPMAANCCKATAQRLWEFERDWQRYLQTKDQYWRSIGKDPGSGEVKIHEAQMLARQPSGYFIHPNVLAAFLAMGIPCAAAVVVSGWRLRRREGRVVDSRSIDGSSAGTQPSSLSSKRTPPRRVPADRDPHRIGGRHGPSGKLGAGSAADHRMPETGGLRPVPLFWLYITGIVMLTLVLGSLVILRWVGSAGAIAGLLAAGLVAVLAWQWRHSPARTALALGGTWILLQVVLVSLTLRAPTLYPALSAHGGKTKSLAVRLNYWQAAIRLFTENPLTGIGPGQMVERYLAVKPVCATEEITHVHNWLLNQAAEWGVIGAAGLLVALAGCGWIILRPHAAPKLDACSVGRSDGSFRRQPRMAWKALLLVLLVTGCCWCLVWPQMDAANLAAIAASLLVSAIIAVLPVQQDIGRILILAGLFGLLVQTSVEMTGGVAGATWPFWAAAALAMAWARPADEPSPPGSPKAMARVRVVPVSAAIVAMAAILLTLSPMRATAKMNVARRIMADTPQLAAQQLVEAAAIDEMDPVPLKAAALVWHKLAAADPANAVYDLREARRLFQEALQRDRLNSILLWNLALADQYLFNLTRESAFCGEALEVMQQSLARYPTWLQGWQELTRMAAGGYEVRTDQPEVLRIALWAADKALALDDAWPADDLRKLTPPDRSRLLQTREKIAGKLQDAISKPVRQTRP